MREEGKGKGEEASTVRLLLKRILARTRKKGEEEEGG